MTLFSVDETRCKQDGICAAECPVGIISWKKGGFPSPSAKAEGLCISCGHCVAVCPHQALTHNHMAPGDCLELDKAFSLSPEQTEHFLRARRSIRNFKETSVDKETLTEIIRLASFAPSGHNTQPVRWRVISGTDKVKDHTAMVIDWMKETKKQNPALARALYLDMMIGAWKFGVNTVTRDAPVLILAQGDAKNPMSSQACTIAMTYLDLAAQSFGVGTCWSGYFQVAANAHAPLAEKLGQGEGLKTYGVVMAGHPKYKYHRMPMRNAPDITWM